MKISIPQIGDYRSKTCFLLFPKTIGNEKRWLEKTTWKEKLMCHPIPYQDCHPNWFAIQWENGQSIEKNIIEANNKQNKEWHKILSMSQGNCKTGPSDYGLTPDC